MGTSIRADAVLVNLCSFVHVCMNVSVLGQK